MQKSKWRFGRDAFAVFLLIAALYVVGFIGLRAFYVDCIKSPGGCTYSSQALALKPTGLLGKAVDFYKPAFLLEAYCHGSDRVVINGWRSGMRAW